jgi:hypothetical protein
VSDPNLAFCVSERFSFGYQASHGFPQSIELLMELAQLAYVAGHFPVNVVNTLVHNFELSANVFKTFHASNWAGNSCVTAFSFLPL